MGNGASDSLPYGIRAAKPPGSPGDPESETAVNGLKARPPVYVALDFSSAEEAWLMVEALGDEGTHYKVGLELFLAAGSPMVTSLIQRGKQVFLDLKFHDIPNTVRHAAKEAAKLGVQLITVHALGGDEMLRAAVAGAAEGSTGVLAVTLLTSMDERDIGRVGLRDLSSPQHAARLAALASEAGVHGVVCSAGDLAAIREAAPGLRRLVPGIRPDGFPAGDQARAARPIEAVRLGADYLVIGRPVTRAADPLSALRAIFAEMET